MRPRTRGGWTVMVVVLVGAVLLLLGLVAAVGWTAYWVDAVPGGDAGSGTSPELEAGRFAGLLLGSALLLLGLGTGGVLLHSVRSRRAVR